MSDNGHALAVQVPGQVQYPAQIRVAPLSIAMAAKFGQVMATEKASADQQTAKIIMGQQLGLSYIDAVNGIDVFGGKFIIEGKLLNQFFKRHPLYRCVITHQDVVPVFTDPKDFNVLPVEEKKRIAGLYTEVTVSYREAVGEPWEVVGTSRFSVADAMVRGDFPVSKKPPWQITNTRMYFYKAIAEAHILWAPDLLDYFYALYGTQGIKFDVDVETGAILDDDVVEATYTTEGEAE
jgi:hypothetical protein